MMSATVCPSAEKLRALSLGKLPDEQSDELFAHLRTCEPCKSELDAVLDVEDSLISSLRSPDLSTAFEDEPSCRQAIARALAALDQVDDLSQLSDTGSLPKSIGEYEILGPLGRGGMGRVFLARHTKLGRQVALKVLAAHRLADARMRDRFEVEMRAVGRLSHPNIVTAHDAREVEGTAVLVTEFIDGLDLGQLVQRTGPLAINNACEIMRQVACALEYTSGQGFVHRDVKPSNIMLSRTGQVKLLDLGLARLQFGPEEQPDITGTGQAMGTADYVAPEQVTDSRAVDVRADIYSLSCTLFKLLTGQAPFADEVHTTAFAKMTAHVSKQPPRLADFLPNVPPTLDKLVDRMLAKVPDDRPSHPQLVAEELAAFTTGCDLRLLIEQAVDQAPQDQDSLRSANMATRSTSTRATRESSFWRRRVPLTLAIATGFFGILLGLCLGIMITITNPDGSKTIMHLPLGSKVEVSEEPNAATDASTNNQSKGEPALATTLGDEQLLFVGRPAPLLFGVFVNRESNNRRPFAREAQIVEATEVLQRAEANSGFVRTDIGLWFPLENDLPVPIRAFSGGKPYGLIATGSDYFIGWSDIHGHVTGTTYSPSSSQLTAFFDEQLANKMRHLSGGNIRNQLAIIVDYRIRSAPYINAEISSTVSITGTFASGELYQLSQWLSAGLVQPVPSSPSPAPTTEPKMSMTPQEAFKSFLQNSFDSGASQSGRPSSPTEGAQESRKGAPTPGSPTSFDNLKQIGLAFHNFHDVYRKFPGSSNRLEGGRGVAKRQQAFPFSWRVAILPFIEQFALFEQYRFYEPWDSEHNLGLLDNMPDIYRSPYAPSEQPHGETNYVGFAGDQSALGAEGGVAMSEFRDGTSQTLLVVETKNSLPWTKPEDLPFNGAEDAKQATPSLSLSSKGNALYYLTADGAPHLMNPVDWELLAKLITRAGGEAIQSPESRR